MARIAGVELKNNKKVYYEIQNIYGVGRFTAKKLLESVSVELETRTQELTDTQISAVNKLIEKNYKIEGELRQTVFNNIKRLKDIRSFRGMRHKANLPVNGQNTRSNSRTRKGKSLAVGGLKRILDKK